MPSLTVQYMSDSGTVELSRDCGEEGTRHMSCRGKEDRDTILNDLTCIDEADAADNTLKATTDTSISLIDIHQKSVNLISKVVTDNMEDNRIDDTSSNKIDEPNHIEEKLNLDDLMMGDQPVSAATTVSSSHSNIDTKPTKKSLKKFDDKYFKKSINKKKAINKKIDSNEEFMLGDQPIEDIIIKTNSGEEILPHSKKSLPEDLKHRETSTITIQSTPNEIISTTQPSTIVSSSTETRLRRETEMSTNADAQTTTESIAAQQSTTIHIESTSEKPMSMPTNAPVNTANVHVPKITKKSFNSHQSRHKDIDFGTTPHHFREKSDVDLTNDHFIPPMLLVRTKFTSTKPHIDETTIVGHRESVEQHSESLATIVVTESNPPEETTVIILDTTSEKVVTNEPLVGTTSTTILSTNDGSSSESPITTESTKHVDEVSSTTTITTTAIPVTIVPPTTKSIIITDHAVESITNAPSFRQPHAPWHTTAHSTTTTTPEIVSSTTTSPSSTTTNAPKYTSIPLTTDDRIIEIKTDTTTETILVTSKIATSPTSIVTEFGNATTIVAAKSTELTNPTVEASSTTTTRTTTEKQEIPEEQSASSTIAALSAIEDVASTEDNTNHSDFTNAENFHPYRPNRRRSLTKPEVHTYIKKILG